MLRVNDAFCNNTKKAPRSAISGLSVCRALPSRLDLAFALIAKVNDRYKFKEIK